MRAERHTFSLVEWTPEDRDVGICQSLNLNSNCINVTDKEGVVCIGGIRKGSCNVKVCGFGVETTPPLFARNIVEASGSIPICGKCEFPASR